MKAQTLLRAIFFFLIFSAFISLVMKENIDSRRVIITLIVSVAFSFGYEFVVKRLK